MTETGILQDLEHKNMVSDACSEQTREVHTNAHTLTLPEVGAIFVILSVGVALSTTVLACEMIYLKLYLYCSKIRKFSQKLCLSITKIRK